MRIPVFHDDQHGTSIPSPPRSINGLRVVGKAARPGPPRHLGGRRGGARLLDLLVDMGMPIANITVTDIVGWSMRAARS